MRYDNIFSVLIAPALASCACFAFEMSGNFAESWNNRFEELRRGFEMLGGKAKPTDIQLSFQQVPEFDSPTGSLYYHSGWRALYHATYEYAGLLLYKWKGWI